MCKVGVRIEIFPPVRSPAEPTVYCGKNPGPVKTWSFETNQNFKDQRKVSSGQRK